MYLLLKMMIQLPCNLPCRYGAIIKHKCRQLFFKLHLVHFHVSRRSAFREARLLLGSPWAPSIRLPYHPEPHSAIGMSEFATAHYIRSLSCAKAAARCKRNLSRYDCYQEYISGLATSPQMTVFSSKQKN